MKFLLSFYLCLAFLSPVFCQLDEATELQIDALYNNFEAGNYERTIELANMLIKKKKDNPMAWLMKGKALFLLARDPEALEAFSISIGIKPDYWEAYFCRAMLYSTLEEYNSAIQDIQVALKYEPKKVELLAARGNFFLQKGSYKNALKSYSLAIAADSTYAEAFTFRAAASRELGAYKNAIQDATRAIQLDSSHPTSYETRAFSYLEEGEAPKAIQDFHQIIQIIQKDSSQFPPFLLTYAYNNLGFAHYKAGDHALALKNINYSLQRIASNSYAYKNRALVFFATHKKKAACQDLLKAQQLGYLEEYGEEVEELLKQHCP